MNKHQIKRTLVIVIISLFIGASLVPIISGIGINTNGINVNKLGKSQDTSPITFYTFDKTSSKECSVGLSEDVVEEIVGMIEDLKYKIVNDPFSEETKTLKSEFVDILDVNDLLPVGISKDKVISLLNPFWLGWFDKSSGLNLKSSIFTSVNNVFNGLGILQRFFLSPDIIDFLGGNPRPGGSGSLLFCNIASGGQGLPFPLFLLPRPRGFVIWSGHDYCVTNVGSLLSGRGFLAGGAQSGFALGFLGVGLTYSVLGVSYYAFIGYSTFAYVNADVIQWYAPPNAKPVISDESPFDGAVDVPVSLSELSFRISDGDGDRMSYSVTTSPNIGSGSGNFKKDGVYSVPVSGLKGNTEYNWRVVVNDEYDSVEKTFSFTTERIAPVVSDPLPFDGDDWVSIDTSELSFQLKDFQGDLMDYTVETSPDIGSSSGSGVGNGVYSVDVEGLDYTTVYSWFVNVTDGVYWTREVFVFKTQPIMVFDPFDEGWSYRKKITVDHDLVDGDLVDFPVLVSVVDGDLGVKAQGDGDDILFMDGSGVADRLFHEIEFFGGSSGELVAWVSLSDLDGDVDSVFYVYYGNSGCYSQEYPNKVWDSDYVAVYHMNYVTGNMIDSTINNNIFNVVNAPSYLQDGKVGYCLDFDGVNDFFENNNMDLTGLNEFTLTAWIQPDVVTGDNVDYIFSSKYNSEDDIRLAIKGGGNGNSGFQGVYDDGVIDGIIDMTHTFIADNWYFYASTCDNNKGESKLYKNNELLGRDDDVNFKFNGLDNYHRIGHRSIYNTPKYFDGSLEEIRISKIARSDDWILTEFNNQNDPASFMSFGPEETGP